MSNMHVLPVTSPQSTVHKCSYKRAESACSLACKSGMLESSNCARLAMVYALYVRYHAFEHSIFTAPLFRLPRTDSVSHARRGTRCRPRCRRRSCEPKPYQPNEPTETRPRRINAPSNAQSLFSSPSQKPHHAAELPCALITSRQVAKALPSNEW